MNTVFIGLGSNLENPKQQIKQAVELLKTSLDEKIKVSPYYQSKAIGPGEQPNYINAVAMITTNLAALDVLKRLQAIETQQGRLRGDIQFSPRTLDLDILLYNNELINHADLQVPHPRMLERNFVIMPLFDLAPNLQINGQTISEIKDALSYEGLVKTTKNC